VKIRLCLVLLVTCLTVAVAAGATYHVAQQAPGASDDNPGSLEQPWLTIGKAAETAQAGDAVYIHAGVYREAVKVKNEGAPGAPIEFRASEDDEVVLEGTDPVPADQWQPVEGFTKVYAMPLERDPGQVLVDSKPIYMKVVKLGPTSWELGQLTDEDVGWWQWDSAGKRLLLNLGGGNPAAEHRIEVPVRVHGFILSSRCRLTGIHARNYANVGITTGADDVVIEDCLATGCRIGIRVTGWNRTGTIVRRNTVIGSLADGMHHSDRPRGARIEENLLIRNCLNPWHSVGWVGSMKINGAYDLIYRHNVVLEGGNRETPNGWDGWGLWGDCLIGRVFYVGNTAAHNEHAGLYIEHGMADTRAYYNTLYKNDMGITCRASQRGVFLHNYVEGSRGSGLAVWKAVEPYPTVNNVFGHNLVRNCPQPLVVQQPPQFIDHNVYWPLTADAPASVGAGKFATLGELSAAEGYEREGEVADDRPEDLGIALVTFRVADAADPDEVLMMIGNNGCELDDPIDNDTLPYFWRAGTGDGVEREVTYWVYAGLPEPKGRFVSTLPLYTYTYRGAGATVCFAEFQEPAARSGRRCLEVCGVTPERIPEEGMGWWTPVLPARPGDRIKVSYWVRGQDLKPTGDTALAAFAEFSSYTGQRRTRASLTPADRKISGTFDWEQVEATVTVPEAARRVAFFFGLKPAEGEMLFDDFSLGVEAAPAEAGPTTAAEPPAVGLECSLRGETLTIRADYSRVEGLEEGDTLRIRLKREWMPLATKTAPVDVAKGTSEVEMEAPDLAPGAHRLYAEVLGRDGAVKAAARITFTAPRRSPEEGKPREDRISLEGLWRARITAKLPAVDDLAKAHADPGISDEAKRLVVEGVDDSKWGEHRVPGAWEEYGEEWAAVDGEVVYRRKIVVPPDWFGKDLLLSLGPVDDYDVTFFNGVQVGATDEKTPEFYAHPRRYVIPAGLAKLGENLLAVRVFDRGLGGGFMGKPEALFLEPKE